MSNILKRKSLWAIVFISLIIGMVWIKPAKGAASPRLIPFQGRLNDSSGEALNGVYPITFVIYDKPTGGNALWSEDHESVSVINGQLNVLLGSKNNLDDPDGNGDPSDALQFTSPHFLGIKVGADSNQEMVPRQQLAPAFHAFQSTSSDTLIAHHEDGRMSSYGINRIVPIGLISPYFGDPATLPDNWMVCDGSMVDDPGSPLNGVVLPDLKEKFIRGESDGSRNIIGSFATGGAETLPEHSHTINSDGGHSHTGTTAAGGVDHTHNMSCDIFDRVDDQRCEDGDKHVADNDHGHHIECTTQAASAYLHTHSFGTSVNGSHSHGGTTGPVSSTTAISHLPSYIALHYIIRIK